jgi:hypothetical protein
VSHFDETRTFNVAEASAKKPAQYQ